ncbi:MAG: WbqC family protein [Cyclobacteriaceae bacterium]|nr:WbqC family protein [Cyclobacteriaceae bacterium]
MEASEVKGKKILIELHYLPSLAYIGFLNASSALIIDPDDIYSKQTYRNRCRIRGANSVEDLIVPVKKISGQKTPMRQVEIDYGQKWINRHTRAIQSAYGKAPFFEYYAEELLSIYSQKPVLLMELNLLLLTKCLEVVELDKQPLIVSELDETEKNSFLNLKNEINPKKTFSGDSGLMTMEYFQVFGSNFAPNLSIIDLIFCEGPQARDYIMRTSV